MKKDSKNQADGDPAVPEPEGEVKAGREEAALAEEIQGDTRDAEAAIRGALALMSSAASGFFFWGMIEEPDAQASATSANPNSSLDHNTTSPASLERWVAQVAAAAK